MHKFIILFLVSFASLQLQASDEGLPAAESDERLSFNYTAVREPLPCDFVAAEATAILRRLGAFDIRVRCTGGAPYNRDHRISARFTSIRQTTEDKSTRRANMMPVSLHFQELCDLREVLVGELMQGFDVHEFKSEGSCVRSKGQLSYEFLTLQ